MKKWLLILVSVLQGLLCFATETLIVGVVTDAEEGTPLANVNISFRGTKIGTTSDSDGAFILHVDMKSEGKLRFSAVGYQSQTFVIAAGEHRGMDVRMVEKVNELNEFQVTPVNEALPIIDSIRSHKPAYREGRTILEEDELAELLPIALPEHMDVYQATMEFGSVSFLSPLARSGTTFYNFWLRDSVETESGLLYHIDFIPKNGFDPLLRGRLEVEKDTYHVRHVSARMSYRANVNFLNRLDYVADYDRGYLVRDTLHTTWSWRFFRDSTASKHELPISQLSRVVYEEVPQLNASQPVLPAQTKTLLTPDSLLYPQNVIYGIARYLAYTATTGYLGTGSWLDFGKISDIMQYSAYEGFHVGLPFRTNERLMKHVSLEGYVAYGFRDEGFKWKAQISARIPAERRNLLGFYAWDRYAQSEFTDVGSLFSENKYETENYRTSAIVGLAKEIVHWKYPSVITSYRKRELRAWWESDWCDSHGARPAVETTTSVSFSKVSITHPYKGWRYNDCEYVETASLSLLARLSWGERTKDIFTVRRHRYGKYPSLQLGATFGSVRPEGQKTPGTLYAKFMLQIHQTIGLGVGGLLEYWFQGTLNLGNVPNQLLDPMGENHSWFSQPYQFSLLPLTYTRRSVGIYTYWNGGGILFNRIPGVRYLRLREVAFLNTAYADTFRHPNVEAGLGIGNVLGLLELYCVARFTPIPVATSESIPWVGLRVRMRFGL